MHVQITPDDADTYKADSRGRINLGTDYADRKVEIAILDNEENTDES